MAKSSSALSRRVSEVVGVALFAAALIWLIALATYDPNDPAWFFSAGRFEKSSDAKTFPQTGIGYDQGVDNKRGELKGTVTPWANNTVTVGFTDNSTTQSNRPCLAGSIDPRTLVTRQLPNTLFVSS